MEVKEIEKYNLFLNGVIILIFLIKSKQLQEKQKEILFYIHEYEKRNENRELFNISIKKKKKLYDRKQIRKYRKYRLQTFRKVKSGLFEKRSNQEI